MTSRNLREFHVGTNKLLKKIDLTNCSGFGKHDQKTLDISDCANIEEVYAEGTSITGIELPESWLFEN